ncbi:uncharacterized protein LOC144160591 [Haemaphysalis longicornis]
MANADALAALRQQVQQLQPELKQTKQQQQSRNAPANEDVATGSAEDVRAPTEAFPQAASWRVAVKLPPFWADSLEVWFAQVEAHFSLARITQDRTRYDYAIAHLDARYANQVRDILANLPTDNLYVHLQTELIRRLSLSEEQKIRQLQSAELAERKPSQLLRHLCALEGNMQVQDSFLRLLWLQRLPPHAQAILQAQVKLPLDELAEIAHRVVDTPSPQLSPTIQAVAAPLNALEFTRRIHDIDQRLTSIQQHLDERLPTAQRRHSQSRYRNTTSSPQPDINGPCYYHDASRQLVETAASCQRGGRRIFVTDQITKQRYLVDSGSDVCCYPRHHLQGPRAATSFELSAANQSTIKTYGSLRLHIQIKNLCRDFHWNFVITDVAELIIGSDFLAHNNLLPDCRNIQLIDATTGNSTPGQPMTAQQPSIKVLSIDNPSPYHAILAEFPGLTRPSGLPRKVQHTTVHYIRTTSGPPVFCRARRVAPDRMRIGKAEFEAMLREGTARRSDSPWASPLHLVPKKTEGWRPCGDYRALNARTIPDRYPVRHIQDFAHCIHGCHVFSVLDLVKAYTQIPVNPDDVPKTAIIKPFGLLEFSLMSFGLPNAGQTFQRFIDDVVRGLDFCFVYLDDILVFSRDTEEHHRHFRLLFERLDDHGLLVNIQKSTLGTSVVHFLGHEVSSEGIRPLPQRISDLQNYPRPTTAKDLRRFLGMLNFYRRFLPHAAEHQAHLHDALAGLRVNQPVTWTPTLAKTFEDCKAAPCTATLLTHLVPDAPSGLFTDASSFAIGAALMQRVDNTWHPLAFFSKKLATPKTTPSVASSTDETMTTAPTNLPAYYRELLAIYEAVQHFRHILEAQNCTIYTDHKPLTYTFSQRRHKLPPVQQNQLSFIAQFTTDIQNVSGKDNVVADPLSRVATICSAQITADVLAEAKTTDAELQELLKGTSSLQLQEVPIQGSAGPYRYCLTAIDRYTRWPETWPLEGITAEDVASAFFTGWIARFGASHRVTTDQGRQLESHLFRLLGLTIGFERLRTTSYLPCTNGMTERFHRQFKAAIMCHPDSTWLEAIPAVILGLRATFKPHIHATPAELVYGEPLRLPGEFLAALPSSTLPSDPTDFVARLRRTIATSRPSPAAQHSKPTPFVFKKLASCTHAFFRDDTVRRPFQPPYSRPHLVVRRDDKIFTLRLHGNDVRVSIDRLKPAYIAANEPGSATPPQAPFHSRRRRSPLLSRHALDIWCTSQISTDPEGSVLRGGVVWQPLRTNLRSLRLVTV